MVHRCEGVWWSVKVSEEGAAGARKGELLQEEEEVGWVHGRRERLTGG